MSLLFILDLNHCHLRDLDNCSRWQCRCLVNNSQVCFHLGHIYLPYTSMQRTDRYKSIMLKFFFIIAFQCVMIQMWLYSHPTKKKEKKENWKRNSVGSPVAHNTKHSDKGTITRSVEIIWSAQHTPTLTPRQPLNPGHKTMSRSRFNHLFSVDVDTLSSPHRQTFSFKSPKLLSAATWRAAQVHISLL